LSRTRLIELLQVVERVETSRPTTSRQAGRTGRGVRGDRFLLGNIRTSVRL